MEKQRDVGGGGDDPGSASGDRKTILICDDQKDVVNACYISLRNKYFVLKAWSGRECISIYSSYASRGAKIDLVLLDYKLGDMTGEDVAREIARIALTNIILITAYDLEDSMIQSLLRKNLISAQLKKPFSLEELQAKVSLVLSQG